MKVFRTVFHPDSEYAGFVGSYKPFVVEKDITYAFVPQIFAKAYVYAWEHPRQLVCLAIDEINRGNCAQIFGDLFQLLDRNETGFSEYALLADADLAGYLEASISDDAAYSAATGGIDQLKLPPNFYIYATMNTSDQSLFPMDSAFKRRWDWEYVPIDYADANEFTIVLSNDFVYKWGNFIECVNRFIVELTGSEDKQLGNRFVNPHDKIISLSMFKSKVLFYLWSDIYKNEPDKTTNIFVYQPADAPDTVLFSFSQLYEKQSDGTPLDLEILPSFMRQLGLEAIPIR
jgi:5-methylcytosine-specific restriction endonuclease McrBC GTP-binding regulatory subunit McrB